MGACISSGKDRSLSKNYSLTKDYLSSEVTQTPKQTNRGRFHHKILLVGRTGAGKSTAINMFVNLVY